MLSLPIGVGVVVPMRIMRNFDDVRFSAVQALDAVHSKCAAHKRARVGLPRLLRARP